MRRKFAALILAAVLAAPAASGAGVAPAEFGAFSVSLTSQNDAYHAHLVTTAVFLLILLVGWTRGFPALEWLEQVSVGIKLAVIAGLLFGLGWFFVGRLEASALLFNPPEVSWW